MCVGLIGRLLAGVAVTQSWGGQGDFGWFWTFRWLSAQGSKTGIGSYNLHQRARRPASGPRMGAPPPRVAGLVFSGSDQAQRAFLLWRERSPGAGDHTCRPIQPRDPADTARCPRGDVARGCIQGEVRPASPKGRRAPASGSPEPGPLLSFRVPCFDSGRRSAPERLGLPETVQSAPERSRRGSTQGHSERPG